MKVSLCSSACCTGLVATCWTDRTCWRVARWRTTGALDGMSLDVLLEGGSLMFRDGGLSCGRFASGAYLGGHPF